MPSRHPLCLEHGFGFSSHSKSALQSRTDPQWKVNARAPRASGAHELAWAAQRSNQRAFGKDSRGTEDTE